MKRKLLISSALISLTVLLYGGGIITNTNQSASWVRMPSRNATIGIDGVYYNPAGLSLLNDGFHLSLNNQTIFQSKDVKNNYQFLTQTPFTYKGEIKVPLFPDIYAVWKKNKLAVSFGFSPVGGGGGATYEDGLPSFEMGVSDLKPLLTNMGLTTTQYSADINFEGTSAYLGYQLGLSYQLADLASFFVGARLITAKNTYNGYIRNIMINPLHPLVNPTAAMISAPTFFTTIGQPVYAALTSDIEVDAEQTATAVTPIIGLNLALNEKINIGVKYELKTTVDLKTKVNDNKAYPGFLEQDSVVHGDMPAMISAGVDYKATPKLLTTLSLNYYFDKAVNYGKTLNDLPVKNDKVIDKNFYEIGIGAEYSISEKFLVSVGYLRAITGVSKQYQSDMDYSLSSNTIGGGIGYKVKDNIMINLGFDYVTYNEDQKTFDHVLGAASIPVAETYYKDTIIIALGLDFSFE